MKLLDLLRRHSVGLVERRHTYLA